MTETIHAQTGSTLARKLAEVMAAVERIPKRGWNAHFSYAFATEADVVDAIRGELASRAIVLLPAVLVTHRDPLDKTTLTTLEMEFTFIDGVTGERETRAWVGTGSDRDDKGVYKAMTGAEKTFLLKAFLIPTGDDPEAVEKAEDVEAAREPNDEQDEPPHPADVAPAAKATTTKKPATSTRVPAGAFKVKSVSDPIEGSNDRGPWTRWIVEFEQGPRLSTFSATVSKIAIDACKRGIPVVPTIMANKLTGLEASS
jgi:hypothetical protein